MRSLLFFLSLLISGGIYSQFVFKPAIDIDLKSPAGVYYDQAQKRYFVASEHRVFVLDENGKIVKQVDVPGAYDLKALTKVGPQFYLVDESLRKVFVLKADDLSIQKEFIVPYSGPIERGFETIFFNPIRETITLITEKSPTVIIELNYEMKKTNQEVMKGFREISDAVFAQNFIWVLSDELHTVYKLDPSTYKVIQEWNVPVLNPEGICLMNNQKMEFVIVSNKGQKLHFISFKDKQVDGLDEEQNKKLF